MTPLAKNNLAAPDIRLDYRGSLISGVSFMSISSIVFKKWEEGGGGGRHPVQGWPKKSSVNRVN